jgi:O-antigen ligase
MAAALLQVTLLADGHIAAQIARWRGWLAAGTLVCLVAVALSLTRAAWVGLVFGLFLVLLASPRRRLAIAVGGVAAALVVLALVANSALAGGGSGLAELSWERVLTSRSIFFRIDAYVRAWEDFVASPILGNGVNVFAQNHVSPSGSRDWISNFFLMTLHDTGVVGLLLLVGWLGWLAVETWRALGRTTGIQRSFLLALSIAYVALFVTYQATTVFWLGFNWVYLGLVRAGSVKLKV